MEDAEKQLRAYLSKLLNIEDNKKIVLAEADLERISLELGISWQEVKTIRDRHLQKADSFLSNSLFAEAITEYKECLVLHPNLQEAVLGLAKASYGKWFVQPTTENRQAAILAVRSAIDLYPAEQETYRLLKSLQSLPEIRISSGKSPQKAWVILVGLLMAVLMAGAILFLSVKSPSDPPESPNNSAPMPSTSVEEATPAPSEESTMPAIASPSVPKNAESKKGTTTEPLPKIDVVFDAQTENGLDFQIENSELSLYPNSHAYKLTGYFQVKNTEVDKLKIRIEGLDASGKVLFAEYKDAIGSFSRQTFRPGDMIPFDFLLYKEGQSQTTLQNIRLTIQEIRKEEAAPSYAASKPVNLVWNFEKSPNVDLSAAIRESQLSDYSLGTKGTIHHYILEFKNTGNQHLSQVKFAIEYLDKDQKALNLCERYAVVTNGAKLRRGDTRLFHGTYIIDDITPRNIAGFKVRIVEAR